MTKLTIMAADYDVYDMNRIAAELAKAYDWDDYTVNADNTVSFRGNNEEGTGEMVGYDFCYTSDMDEGVLDWLEAVHGDHAIRAKTEDGKDVFLVIG